MKFSFVSYIFSDSSSLPRPLYISLSTRSILQSEKHVSSTMDLGRKSGNRGTITASYVTMAK